MSGAFGKAIAAGAAVVAMGLAFGADAQQTVKIGAIYPLSGNAASAGNYSQGGHRAGGRHRQQRRIPSSRICR